MATQSPAVSPYFSFCEINSVLVDQEGTCKGDICRLDKQFAEELTEIYEWSTDLEAESGFDREQACTSGSGSYFLILTKNNRKLSPLTCSDEKGGCLAGRDRCGSKRARA